MPVRAQELSRIVPPVQIILKPLPMKSFMRRMEFVMTVMSFWPLRRCNRAWHVVLESIMMVSPSWIRRAAFSAMASLLSLLMALRRL